jgi:hypothetical protein
MILHIALFAVASLLLAAHFLRQGSLALVAVSLLVPLLFIVRRPWSLMVLQVAAYLAGAIWIATAIQMVHERLAMGRPWALAAIILGAVAGFTVIAGALLNSRAIKEKYRSPG